MLVTSNHYQSAKASKREQITLLFSGVILAVVILIFSLVYVGFQGSWYNFVHHKVVVNDPLHTYRSFMMCFNDETQARVKEWANLSKLAAQTDKALSHFIQDVQEDNGVSVHDLKVSFAKYRDSATGSDNMGPLLKSHIDVAEAASIELFALMYSTFAPRLEAASNTLITEATVTAYSSVASRAQFLHGMHSHLTGANHDVVSETEVVHLAISVAVAESFSRMASVIDQDSITNTHTSLLEEMLEPARDIVKKGTVFSPPTPDLPSISMPIVREAVWGFSRFLTEREDLSGAYVSQELRALMLIAIGAVLTCLALIAAAYILLKNHKNVEPARKLAAAFEDSSHRRHLRMHYMPLLQDLRAISLPSLSEAKKATEVEREYLIAAQAVDTLRVAVPQLLMNTSKVSSLASSSAGAVSSLNSVNSTNKHAKGHISGRFESLWSSSRGRLTDQSKSCLLSRPVRLELGSMVCRCAVVMVLNVFFSRNDTRHTQDSLESDLATLSTLFRVVVEEVNLSGGVVVGFHDGLNIMCAWNIDASSNAQAEDGEAVATAIRVSWIVRYRLQSEEHVVADPATLSAGATAVPPISHLCACIVSGPAVLSNDAVIGDRHDAFLQGAFLENLERMRRVAATAPTSTLLDAATQQRLRVPRQRHSCKPLVTLKNASLSGTFTIYSASEEDGNITADQATLYNAGFVLYQNNMIKEAVNEFSRYLTLYPEDKSARWLMNQVLLPRQCIIDLH